RLTLRPTDVAGAVDAALTALEDPSGVEVEIPEGLEVLADGRRLELIVASLVENALNHGAPPVIVEAWDGPDGIDLVVTDAGRGPAPGSRRVTSAFMGLMKRFSEVMKAKTSKMLDKAEDPRETLDYSYEKQLEMVQKVRRGLADVATSRKRLELQATQLQASSDKLEQQARTAVGVGKEDLAREALNRRAGGAGQLAG